MISLNYGFAVDWMRKDLARVAMEEAKNNGSLVTNVTELS